MHSTAKQLDDLFDLQRRRTAQIMKEGQSFQIGHTEHMEKGLVKPSGMIYFLPSASILPGTLVKSTSGEYLIRSATVKAGRIEADAIPVTTRVDILAPGEPVINAVTKQAHRNYSVTAVNVPVNRRPNEIVFSSSSAPRPGSIIKTAVQYLKVTDVLQCGAVSYVRFVECEAPGARKTLPIQIINNGCPDSSVTITGGFKSIW